MPNNQIYIDWLRLASQLKAKEGDISAKLNLSIARAESKCSEWLSNMDPSKELHEAEVRP